MGIRETIAEFGSSARFEECDCRDIFGEEKHLFYLRYLPQGLWERYQSAVMKGLPKNEPRGLQVMLLAMSLCDEQGEPLYEYKKTDHMEVVSRIPAIISGRLAKKAQEMNSETEEDLKANAGNFESGTIGDYS